LPFEEEHVDHQAVVTGDLAIYPLFRLISWNLTSQCLAVTGRGSVGEYGRLSQLLLGT